MASSILHDRYHFISKLATGEIGTVFRVLDTHNNTERAIRILHSHFAIHQPICSIFHKTAMIIQRIQHQNIAAIYEYDTYDQMPYIVMEFLPGGSLLDRLETHGVLHPQQAIAAIINICQALQHAHHNYVLHHDVSPNNMLISRNGVIKLTDFAMTQIDDVIVDTLEVLPPTKTRLYLPPERDRKEEDLSPASDLFGAAASFYTLLTSKRPTQIFIPRIQEKSFTSLHPNIADFLKKGCHANPKQRFRHAEEMVEALYKLAQQLPPLPESCDPIYICSAEPETDDPAEFDGFIPNYQKEMEQLHQQQEPPVDINDVDANTTLPPGIFTRDYIQKKIAVAQKEAKPVQIPSKKESFQPPPINTGKAKAAPSLQEEATTDNQNKRILLVLMVACTIIGVFFFSLRKGTIKPVFMDKFIIPKGEFGMGTVNLSRPADERPIHKVIITYDFYLTKSEVTQEMWEYIMGTNPSQQQDCPTCPVEMVSWRDAIQFANDLSIKEDLEPCYKIYKNTVTWPKGLECKGYRLPTEAEWEYAARGGSVKLQQSEANRPEEKGSKGATDASDPLQMKTKKTMADNVEGLEKETEKKKKLQVSTESVVRYIFAGSKEIDKVAWYKDNSEDSSHPVCQKQKNQNALCDMTGNVAEWIWDLYGDYAKGVQTDPLGSEEGSYRVVRGGSFRDDANGSWVSFRNLLLDPTKGYPLIGFRLARTK